MATNEASSISFSKPDVSREMKKQASKQKQFSGYLLGDKCCIKISDQVVCIEFQAFLNKLV